MKPYLAKLKNFISIVPIAYVILLIQNLLFLLTYNPEESLIALLLKIVVTNLTMIFFIQGIHVLSFRKKGIAIIINVLLLVIYGLLFAHQFITGEPMDYKLTADSLANFKYLETIEMAVDLEWRLVVQIICLVILLFYAERFFKLFSGTVINKRRSKLIASLIGYLFLINVGPYQKDEIVMLGQSIGYHVLGGQYRNFRMPDSLPKYPYVKVSEISNDTLANGTPHIFIIMMESANGFFIEKKSKDGKEITPFFNSLISKGMYVEHFYSNGNFTTNGQFGLFSGLAPSFKQNILLDQTDLKFKGLPKIINEHGYYTLFMHGYHDLNFGGGKAFLKRSGFEEVKQMDEEFITEEDKKYIWGWGLQDDKIYEKFFQYLDNKKTNNELERPIFASVGTMSHHHDFRSYPKNRPLIYPRASNGEEHFANSMYLADEYLKTFFIELERRDYLKNSLVMIVGDHGFPSAGINIGTNGGFIYSGFSEELFRTPFLMMYDHLKPSRAQLAYAHTDIAPTILDFLKIKELVNFPGISMLGEKKAQHMFHLIQPFDGSYISTMLYPYKYVFHEKSGDEFVFDLSEDPNEENNILASLILTNPSLIDQLRSGQMQAYLHQKLIDEDRIWPHAN